MTTNQYPHPDEIKSVAVIGTGAVGSSWAALLLAHDIRVIAFDPGADAETKTRAFISKAWPALRQLGVALAAQPPLEHLTFVASAALAAQRAEVVQENVSEREDIKAAVLAEISAAAGQHKIILSSTGGMLPTHMQRYCQHPERLVVAHPFNPAHLIPLVEVVGGELTAPAAVEWTLQFVRRLGKQPIKLLKERSGHMVNRLQFALVREAIQCLVDGIASAADIDAAVRYGLGPRWALMGSLMTVHLAGGAGGMAGILKHAGAAMEQWWTPTGELKLTPEVITKLIAAGEQVSHGQPIADWERWRDALLIDLIKLQQAGALTAPASLSQVEGSKS